MSKGIVLVCICCMLFIPGFMCASAIEPETTLTLHVLGGLPFPGLFDVLTCMAINIGNVSAYNVTSTVSITGGLMADINYSDTMNSDEIPPQYGNTFSVVGLHGFGPVSIRMTANASNAQTVSKSVIGFQFGRFTWVPFSWCTPPAFQP